MRWISFLMLLLATAACTPDPPAPAPPSRSVGEVRDCGNSVYGEMDPGWLDTIPPQPDGRRFIKVLAIVDGGKRVTVSLPQSEQTTVALAYTSRNSPDVTFVGCEKETQFNGGFMLTGPARCVPLQVSFDGKTERVVLSFGAGKCAT